MRSALAQPEFFRRPGRCADVLYAEMPVGFDAVHRLAIRLQPFQAACTCRLRTQPCHHTLALAQLYAEQPGAFEQTAELPEWAADLLEKPGATLRTPQKSAPERLEQKNKRFQERLDRAADGLADLDAWLHDTLRRGLATSLSEDSHFLANISRRMADASLPGLARMLRAADQIPVTLADWSEKTAAVLAQLALVTAAFKKREALPEALQADLLGFLGIALKKDDVLTSETPVHGVWAVLGSVEAPLEAALYLRRQWLLHSDGRFALLLDYNFGESGFPPAFPTGDILHGALAFFPSAWPLRALPVGELRPLPKKISKLPGLPSFEALRRQWAAALGAQPWLPSLPVCFPAVTPVFHEGAHWLADPDGARLPLEMPANTAWRLVALSTGRPLSVFGEWNGEKLRILSFIRDEKLVGLEQA